MISFSGREDVPRTPVEIDDEVKLWAREHDRLATLQFVPTAFKDGRMAAGTWLVSLSLKPNDKRMELWRQGLAAEPPSEQVWLHVPVEKAERMGIKPPPNAKPGDYVPLDIVQLGASGVRGFLEQGNMWSGRGEYRSLPEQLQKVRQANQDAKEKYRRDMMLANRHEQRDKRRWRFKIPFLPVGLFPRKGPVSG